MITKKTLTRQSIDELAKVCPPVTSSDTSQIFGEGVYVNSSGVRLATIGSSSAIYVVRDTEKFNELTASGNVTDELLSCCSQHIQMVSDNDFVNVVRGIAGSSFGGVNVVINNDGAMMSYNPAYNRISVNRNSLYNEFYYEMRCSVAHEARHISDFNSTTGNIDINSAEKWAYLSMIAMPEYAYTSYSFKKECAENYIKNSIAQNGSVTETERADIYRYFGV